MTVTNITVAHFNAMFDTITWNPVFDPSDGIMENYYELYWDWESGETVVYKTHKNNYNMKVSELKYASI